MKFCNTCGTNISNNGGNLCFECLKDAQDKKEQKMDKVYHLMQELKKEIEKFEPGFEIFDYVGCDDPPEMTDNEEDAYLIGSVCGCGKEKDFCDGECIEE
jgi:hypothetical protein